MRIKTTRVPRANIGRRHRARLCAAGPILLMAALCAFIGPGLAGDTGAETVAGQVVRGATFDRPLRNGLRFRLQPTPHGWTVWVGQPDRPSENYATVATPPFRGPNPTVIEGWHFRNRDNTGPNATGPLNVNAPQRTRRFRFVLDASAYRKSFDALGILLWPADKDRKTLDGARGTLDAAPKADAELAITDLVPGNLKRGQRAWIERLAFTLRIRYPKN